MKGRRSSPRWPESWLGCPAAVIAAVSLFLAMGLAALAAWRLTGDPAWVDVFFKLPAAVLLVWLTAIELWLCLRVREHFHAGETLGSAWGLIALSAGCGLVGAIYSQILGVDSPMNPLAQIPGFASVPIDLALRQAGLILGGTCRMLLLAGGLAYVLRAYRNRGFLGRLGAVEWLLLSAGAAYVASEFWDVFVAMRGGRRPPLAEMLGWPVNPLLWLLLGEALLIRRSVARMGLGWIGKCWGAFSVGIFLTALGNAGLWAISQGYIQWPWTALTWYIWLPAAGAFALGPAYQLEAIRHATAWRGEKSLDGA